MDPFSVDETTFDDILQNVKGEDITGMTICINTPKDGCIINTEIENLSPVMRQQLLKQLASLIVTYTRLMKFL